jgi:predicted RNA-binding protein (virulence factor B family)
LRNESFQNIKHRDATPEAIKLLFLIYKHYWRRCISLLLKLKALKQMT